jgi:hypothetical protein
LLAALRDGTLSLDAVAQRFRDRSWPRTNDVVRNWVIMDEA